MKKKLVHDWPFVKEDQEKFSSKITELSLQLKEDSLKEVLTVKKSIHSMKEIKLLDLKKDEPTETLTTKLLTESKFSKDF